ncbi:ABC transporter ATP-binding protein [Promethearchaeum syntrophicum]|uniref:ABC transporter ATP-binding protein n=1 Tax=Promethearchaeum syntrophicum TaxID=2594042 RepID=A0A5B9DFL6_9ARCH|nr:ABC transporter ATP-binding protein [Candidatus Prometheoarchaeum syntrophicum]QEE18078.1 Trehalose/maltose import ATP-binding protein MalK [Candidatus Prometheoarchaeum syntrophicum]
MSIIECKNLTKFYGKHRGIENLNLNVKKGEIFGFLGPNGAGKTTTIRTILGFLHKTSGEGSVFGLDISNESMQIRKKIAYLPGELGLYVEMTGRQNLKYLLSLYDVDVEWDKVEQLAKRLNFNMDKKVKELSKGNKQKIGNIMVLAPDVDLYVLDEPTSGLDPLMQMEFYKILRERQEETGATVFLSSHLLPEVEKVADRVGIIRDGTLVEVSTIAELKKLSLKRIEIFTDEPDVIVNQIPEDLIENLMIKESHLDFVCSTTNLPNIFQILSNAKYSDLNITSPALEDIFMRYYSIKQDLEEEKKEEE